MCVSLVVFNQDRPTVYIDSIGDLAQEFGKSNVILRDGFDNTIVYEASNRCLCPIDMDATSKAAGFVCVEHDGDPMEVHWEPAECSARKDEAR